MEKIILVVYLDCRSMDNSDIPYYINKIMEGIANDQILHYILTIKDGDSRVECLNPKLVSEEEYTVAKGFLDRTQKKLDEMLNELKK